MIQAMQIYLQMMPMSFYKGLPLFLTIRR